MKSRTEEAEGPVDWRTQLVRGGYVVLPNIISSALVSAAHTAITRDLAQGLDPARQLEYEHQSYCPDLRAGPEIMNLLLGSSVPELLDAVIGFDSLVYSTGQIAIRRARNANLPRPPDAHIDGIATPHNGLHTPELSTFTLLVGVFLTDIPVEYAGNFTVWPCSHHTIENYFRERGPAALMEGMPSVKLGTPVQLTCTAGDVVLCHYQLAHGVAVNLAAVDRVAVYFRLWLADIDSRRWRLLTHIWDGWKIGPHLFEAG